MRQEPMDFNPLDILATAALGEKASSKDKDTTVSGSTDQEKNSETSESKDAEDDPSDDMGKTKHNCLSSPLSNKPIISVVADMAPQKLSWSPEVFVSCLEKPLLDPKKLIIEELSSDIVKEKLKIVRDCSNGEVVKADENVKDKVDEKDCLSSCDGKNVFDKTVEDSKTTRSEYNSLFFIEQGNEEHSGMPDPIIDNGKEKPCSVEYINSLNSGQDPLNENGGQSDTDTADTNDSKLADEISEITCQDLVSMDHPYCLIPGQLRRMPSMDNTDDDIDVCSDNSPFSEDSEQRSRNFSLDCSYLKSGIIEAVSAGPPDFFTCSLPKPIKEDGGETTSSSAFKHVGVISPRQGQKCAKFKIGTFASFSSRNMELEKSSFSSRNMELEKYLRNKETSNGKKLDIGIPSDSTFSTTTPNSPIYSSVHTLLQSPSLDWDRSEAGSETQDDSSDARTPHRLSPDFTIERPAEYSHPMYHDHDYCNTSQPKHVSEESVKLPLVKRKYTKRKTKLDSVNHEKIMKAKYLKKELLKQDSVLKSAPCHLPETPLTIPEPVILKTNPVGRPRKRPYEKALEEEIDPETGAKMKITGKFQDQYVYYLSKSSRTTSRRRQAPTLPFPSDKILVPAPKPGDIFVPHLTDADIEIVRQRGRGALNIPERPHMPSIPSIQTSCHAHPSLSATHSSELISDVDSHIVSTILSMESDNLVSPSSSQSPELPHTPDLYNTNSELDNLRMINSDNSITSEHVLDYLLSGVKDEVNADSLLHSSASLFPTLPPDPLYSKAGHVDDTDLNHHGHSDVNMNQKLEASNFSSKYLLDQGSSSDSDLLPSDSAYSGNSFVNSVSSSKADDGSTIPDVLSSFISHSQVATTSSSAQESYSQSSLKNVFSPDLNSLDTPQLAASVPRLTSIEKTLDFLGVKDGEIKLENGDLYGSKMSHEVISSPMSTTDSITDDTPWIVTVTLYFNDVPAIMTNSTPFIRLVDIHKQILPAKDTGILKKRCQLLNIPVLNCTEMQRYFLVQYGRAYNSKSTLIVSKEQANTLVTYYATPQPRIGRSEEAHVHRLSCSVSSDGSNRSPVEPLPSGVKKRGNIKNRKSSQQNGVITEPVCSPEPIAQCSNDQSLNKRTRHKKVNYLEMLKGEEKEKEKSSEDSIRETIEAVVKSSPFIFENSKVSKEKSGVKKSHSKKKPNKSESSDSKSKDTLSQRKKSTDSKRKGKGNEKSGKSTKDRDRSGSIKGKAKGSTLKFLKKCDKKVIGRTDETITNEDQQELDLYLSKSKFKPLKLKVNSLLNFAAQRKLVTSPGKKGLFSRSNSSTSTSETDRALRVLAVAHQAAFASGDVDSHLPSQPADIHLDLFTRSSSACVQCHTCSQFLSVPHFMRHHHVPMDNEWLATESAHRVLVPRNKENISEGERKLWEEFHHLQEANGGFGEGDDDSDDDEDEDDDDDESMDDIEEPMKINDPDFVASSDRRHTISSFYKASSSSSCNLPGSSNGISHSLTKPIAFGHEDTGLIRKGHSNHVQISSNDSLHAAGTNIKTDVVKNSLGVSNVVSMPVDLNHGHGVDSGLHPRTSSRKRKSKQLFSIENYCTPVKKGIESEGVFQSSASG